MTRKGASIFLYDENKRFLLQRRTDDAPTYPGEYAFFGGKIEENETPESAVKRECLEELEYELSDPRLVLNVTKDSEYGKHNTSVFLEKYDPAKKLVLHEGQSMGWFNREESRKLKVVDILVDILDEMYDKIE